MFQTLARWSLVVLTTLSVFANAKTLQFSSADKAEIKTEVIETRASMHPLEMTLSIPKASIEADRDGFSSIAIPGLVPNTETGNPEVGTTGTLISVPEGFTPVLEELESHTETIENTVLRPAQHRLRCGVSREAFAFNGSLYTSQGIYPTKRVALEDVGYMQNIHFMRVAFQPVQVDFANQRVLIATDLKVRITFRQTAPLKVSVAPRSLMTLAKQLSANAVDLKNTFRSQRGGEGIVVVVADSFKNTIVPYVDWKTQRGFNVKVVTFTDAGGTKEGVKKYLQNFYDNSAIKPSYFLFVGNNTTLPTYFESTGSGSAASDYQYTLLAGADKIPDVAYGRLTADTEAEVTTQINRWIRYEKDAKADSWYPQAMTIASNEGEKPSDKDYAVQIQDLLKTGNYTKFDSFFQGDLNATAKNITDALTEGRSWIAYFGHGTGTAWGSTNDFFGVTQVDQLTNGNKLPFIIDVACQNGSWVKIKRCFGKAWVTKEANGQAAGAVAFLGGSVNVSWHPPAVMSVGIATTHFQNKISYLGTNILSGQLYMIGKMGSSDETLDNVKWYNLLGDPSLQMRTNVPKELNVQRQSTTRNVQVHVTDKQGGLVQDAIVSIAKPGSPAVALGKTDANGDVLLSTVGPIEAGSAITVTGYNLVTYQAPL